jgi:hypothetical protein
MLHDSSDDDDGGGGGRGGKVGQQSVNKSLNNYIKIILFFSYQAPTNRPVTSLNRSVVNHHVPPANIASPLLKAKSEHSSPTTKTPPSHFSPQTNFSASPTPTTTHRTLPKLPTNGSPSPSLRSSTNTNLFPETHQPSMLFNSDTISIKSDDSSNLSEGHLHPSQQQSSSRNQDIKTRSQQPNTSIHNANNLTKPLTNANSSSTGTTTSSMGIPIDRVPSPSPSLISERDREENERVERELELKRKRLQIYVFICRCVACPFNSKQSSDMARKHLKITLVQYGVIKERFLAFLNGKTHIEADEGKIIKNFFY